MHTDNNTQENIEFINENVDFKKLLKKYIAHIIDQESIDYLSEVKLKDSNVKFSALEQLALHVISEDIE